LDGGPSWFQFIGSLGLAIFGVVVFHIGLFLWLR
jgi:hypothetical protein